MSFHPKYLEERWRYSREPIMRLTIYRISLGLLRLGCRVLRAPTLCVALEGGTIEHTLLVGLNLYGERRRLPWAFQPNNKLLSSTAVSRYAKSLPLTFPNSNQAISFAESTTAVSVARTRPSYTMNGKQSVSR